MHTLSHTTNTSLLDYQVPQLIQNYRTGSAEAISIPFLAIWFVGDIANLVGAVWARLVPTVIALAVYFCIADSVLITQCLYYNFKNRKQASSSQDTAVVDGDEHEVDEEEPLLSRRGSTASGSNVALPGGMRRKSSAARRDSLLAKIDEEEEHDESSMKAMVKNLASILLICALGAAAWAICWKAGIWRPAPSPEHERRHGRKDQGSHGTPLGAEVLGYASAIFYLGARIPQIVKNWREKSCEGLSLLFFLLSMLGNLTYGAGVSWKSCKVLLMLMVHRSYVTV